MANSTMARLFSDCTSAILFVLLGLAACVMLATSAPTPAPTVQRVQVHNAATILDSGVRLSYEALRSNSTTVEEEFNVTVTDGEDMRRLCRIVANYYLVEAIDNDSNIYYYMKQNAMDAVAYWNSTYCRHDCNVSLFEFGSKCQRAVLHSLIHETVNNGDDIGECEWLEHLIREQDLEEKCSQLAEGSFQRCKK